MPYCKRCGLEISEGVDYCSNCGTPVDAKIPKPHLEYATWGERFVAWLIDIIILGIFLAPIKFIFWISWPGFTWAPQFMRWIPFTDFGMDNIIYFVYWVLMEGFYSQSIGKRAMKIKVIKKDGKPMDLVYAVIESVGKAFLLPLDCIIGWILYPTEKQRLFNYISDTIIVKTS